MPKKKLTSAPVPRKIPKGSIICMSRSLLRIMTATPATEPVSTPTNIVKSVRGQPRYAPTITVPVANYDNNQHAENENIRLQNLWDGIETYAALMTMKLS